MASAADATTSSLPISFNDTFPSTMSSLPDNTDNDRDIDARNTTSGPESPFNNFRSSFGPINFTFTGMSPGDLYIPEDNEPFSTTMVTEGNTSSTTTISTVIQCINQTSACHGNRSDIMIFTDEDLWAENDHFARNLIPAMIFVGILMIFGIIGNLLVVYVFGFRFKSATQHCLIVCLACFDLLMSCIAMPAEITDMRFHHTFSSEFACKLLRFITIFSSISSSFTLVTIAMDRHRRVTKPLTKQMTIRRAKMWEVVNVLGALFFSWPLIVMTGLRASETRIAGLIGKDCSFSDDFHGTIFPLVYNAVLGIGFLTLITVVGILYFRIWKTVKGHRVYMANRTRGSISGTSLGELRQNGVSVSSGKIENGVEIKHTRWNTKRGSDINGTVPLGGIAHAGSLPCLRGSRDNEANGKLVKSGSEIKIEISKEVEDGEPHSLQIFTQKSSVVYSHMNGKIEPRFITRININEDEEINNSKNIISNARNGEALKEDDSQRRRSASLSNLPKSKKDSPLVVHHSMSSSKTVTKNQSLTGLPSNLTPSPVLRSKSLKLQPSYSPSITSDDLRPMSSLLESMSKVLLNSSSVHIYDTASPCDKNIPYRQTSNRREERTSNNEDVVSTVDKIVDLEKQMKRDNPNTVDKQTKTKVDGAATVRYVKTVADIDPCSNQSNGVYMTPKDLSGTGRVGTTLTTQALPDTLESNSTHHDVEHKDIYTTRPFLKQETDRKTADDNSLTVLKTADGDISKLSFMEMVSVSDFSHLIGERSKPMAIPGDAMLVSDIDTKMEYLTETQKDTLDDVSIYETNSNNSSFRRRKYESNNPRSTQLAQNNRLTFPEDLNDFAGSGSGRPLSASSTPCSKRRSTVVSVLERYRIRSASAASLDNVTTTSYKSTSRRGVRQIDKTTVVAFAISTVFILSFLPYLVLMFVRAFVKDFDYNLDEASVCVYNVFVRFYFLNSAVNPLLYGLLNERFRHECMRLLSCFSSKKVEQ